MSEYSKFHLQVKDHDDFYENDLIGECDIDWK